MKRRKLLTAAFLSSILLLPTVVLAAPEITIDTTVEKQEILEADGIKNISYVPVDSGTPGDVLRFTLSYQNTGDEIAIGVVLNNPVPAGTRYLSESATSENTESLLFSIDNGATFNAPELLTHESMNPDGKTEIKVASPDIYTNIRWQLLPLDAGTTGSVSFKVQIK